MPTSNPYPVNLHIVNVQTSGSSVTAATFNYYDTAGNLLGTSQLGGSCVLIQFAAPAGQPLYDSIAYQLVPGQSTAGVSLLNATTRPPAGAPFSTRAVNNVVTIPNAVGVELGTVLYCNINGLGFSSPDPRSKNMGK